MAAAGRYSAVAQTVDVSFSTSVGYHDDVLVKPGERSDVPSIDDGFLQFSPSMEGSHSIGSWLLSAGYAYLLNGYGSTKAGVYDDHVGSCLLAWQAAPQWTLSAEGLIERFRRTEFHDFDLDRLEATARLAFRPALEWTGSVQAVLGRIRYTDRPISDSDAHQTDIPSEIELSISHDAQNGWQASAGGGLLDTGSNERSFRYDGFRFFLSGEGDLANRFELALAAKVEKRNYNAGFSRIIRLPDAGVTEIPEPRKDHFYSLTTSVARRLSSGARAFIEASWLDYHSDAPDYSFNETRLRTGLAFQFGPWGSPGRDNPVQWNAIPKSDKTLGPILETGQVRFRCRAPQAKEVALVGSFNGWEKEATFMSDSDGDGIWEVRIPLAAGTYRYMFLVDRQEWRRPEGATLYEDDGFGLENGIIEVP
jgi:hypothetical protein